MSQWTSVNKEVPASKESEPVEAPAAGELTSGTVDSPVNEEAGSSSSEESALPLSPREEAQIQALPPLLKKNARRRANERVREEQAAARAVADVGAMAVAPMGVSEVDLQSLEEMEEQRQQKKAQLLRLDKQLEKKAADLQSVEVLGGLITALRSDAVRGMVETLTTSFRAGTDNDEFPRLSDVQKRQVAATNYNGIVPLEADWRPCDRCVRRLSSRPDHKCVRTPSGCEYCVSKKKGCDFTASSPHYRSDVVPTANIFAVSAAAQWRDEPAFRDCETILQHHQHEQPPCPVSPSSGWLRSYREATSSSSQG